MIKLTLMKKTSSRQTIHYSKLFNIHGNSVKSVASGKKTYKDMRYEKLSQIFLDDNNFSIFDVGFGLAHFYEYLEKHHKNKNIIYSGSEVVREFYEKCSNKYTHLDFNMHDLSIKPLSKKYDYLIFGGTFYQLAGSKKKEFEKYARRMLINGFKSCSKGIAVNFITDKVDYRIKGLYYENLGKITDFIETNISRFYTVEKSYPLFEFTITIYKEDIIKSKFKKKAFKKYFKDFRDQ
jgi:hypothetical protein